MKWFKKTNNMDEREKLELYHIEHICFWLMFATAFIVMFVESFVMDLPFANFAGETIILLIGAFGITIGSIHKGQGELTPKAIILYSLVSALAYAIIFMIVRYFTYDWFPTHLRDLFIIGAIMFVQVFMILIVLFFMIRYFAKKKKDKLEKMYEDDDEDDEQ